MDQRVNGTVIGKADRGSDPDIEQRCRNWIKEIIRKGRS